MRLIDADQITDHEIIDYLGIRYASCLSDVRDLLNDQPTIEAVPAVERNKIIDEFAERCKADIMCQTFGLHPINIDKIAEQMKGGA